MQATHNRLIVGSSPTVPTIFCGVLSKSVKETDLKSVDESLMGSSPMHPTIA